MVELARPLLAAAVRYTATVARVIDAATVAVDVDVRRRVFGGDLWLHNVRVTLAGCVARPMTIPGGIEARNNLATLLPVGHPVTVMTLRTDPGGGVTGRLTVFGADVTDLLVATDWAAAWHGRGPQPVPPWPRPDEEL